MSWPTTTRTVQFRMPTASDMNHRCDTARKEMLALMWVLEDEYQRQDGAQLIFDEGDVAAWRNQLRYVAATLALAQAAFSSIEEDGK
jgi:hypothetical protein